MLRSLPARFDPKISALEERTNIATLLMDELQGILTSYEMRKSNENPSNKEASFKVAKKDKKNVETETSNHEDSEEDMEEANFVKNLKRGIGKYKGKLPLKWFSCGRIEILLLSVLSINIQMEKKKVTSKPKNIRKCIRSHFKEILIKRKVCS